MGSRLQPAHGAVTGLVLAAGLGTRFGGAKLAAPLEGRPLLAHVLDTVRAAVEEGTLAGAVVVLAVGRGARSGAPSDATLLRGLAEARGLRVAENDDPAAGLARSLRLGLAALDRLPVGGHPVAGAMVLLGDQPRTRIDVVRALVAEWRHARVPMLVPRYAGNGPLGPENPGDPGNPVILARELWPLAETLTGDTGMSALMSRRPELVAYLPVEGTNPDVDVPGDLAALEAAAERSLP
jgi:CTP:molybdopterin cytidylyltransferase MocA